MGDRFGALEAKHVAFIDAQRVFFVGTAGAEGRVNVSPKGMDSLRVIDPNRIVWLNLTGSGNETAAHVLENDRMTIMWCAFEGKPLILRAYGVARVVHPRDEKWETYTELFGEVPGARQYFELDVDLVQTSCGFGVPLYDYVEERETLTKWAVTKGPDGVAAYWEAKNQASLDDKPTGIFE